MKKVKDRNDLVMFLKKATNQKREMKMKMVLMSSVCAIIVGVGAYYILMSTGMDTANVMSSVNVRL